MLLPSHRYSSEDVRHWAAAERGDRAWAGLRRMRVAIDRAMSALMAFAAAGPCYAGVSWGKDSMVVAHMIASAKLGVPVIWFPAGQVENPDCARVRDEFLRRYDVRYIEREAAELVWRRDDVHIVHDGGQESFVRVSHEYGRRYVSGVRAQESRTRRMRMAHWGENSANTCAPIGWWRSEDVFAYLALHDLPVHPAYACSWDGAKARAEIRVSTVGGTLGNGGVLGGNGRYQWEERYYPEVMRRVRQMGQEADAKGLVLPA